MVLLSGRHTMKKVKVEKTQEYLKCEFTQKEVEIFADDLSRKIGELDLKKMSKKDVVKSIDAEIAKTEVEISSLATKVKDRYEFRMVPVEKTIDYDKKEKRFMRTDTKETYKNIPLSDSELQLTLEE
jgi:peptidoglycan hydrolase CwlO-like protein